MRSGRKWKRRWGWANSGDCHTMPAGVRPCRFAHVMPSGPDISDRPPCHDHPPASGGHGVCRIVSNEILPPPTHYIGGPAAAADAAFCSLRERRRGSVVPASPLGGAGPVVLLWCGVCRQSAPPLFQRYPGRPQAAALPWLPAGRPHNTRGRRGRSTLCPLVPAALRAIGNAPDKPAQFPVAMPPLGSVPGGALPPFGGAVVACGPSRATGAAIRPPLLPCPPWPAPARVGRVPRRAAAQMQCVRPPWCPGCHPGCYPGCHPGTKYRIRPGYRGHILRLT